MIEFILILEVFSYFFIVIVEVVVWYLVILGIGIVIIWFGGIFKVIKVFVVSLVKLLYFDR